MAESSLRFKIALIDAIVHGWMFKVGGKTGAFKRKRWFVLRGDVISYYKNKVFPDLP
jgi:hypothetical protein